MRRRKVVLSIAEHITCMLHDARAIEGGTEGEKRQEPDIGALAQLVFIRLQFLPLKLLLPSSDLSQKRFQSLDKIRTLSPGPRTNQFMTPSEPEVTGRAREKRTPRTHPDFDSEAAVTTASAVPPVTVSIVLRVLDLLDVALMALTIIRLQESGQRLGAGEILIATYTSKGISPCWVDGNALGGIDRSSDASDGWRFDKWNHDKMPGIKKKREQATFASSCKQYPYGKKSPNNFSEIVLTRRFAYIDP